MPLRIPGSGANTDEMTPVERRWLLVGAVVCVASALFYLHVGYRNYLHSDSASIMLLAQEMIRSGRWLPETWYYVSDATPAFGSAHVAVPFVHAFGASTLAHAATATCTAAAMVLCFWYLGHATGLSRAWSLLGGVLVLSGTSMIYADLLLGQMFTLELAKLALFLGALISLIKGKHIWGSLPILAVVTLAAFVTSPKKGLAFLLVPAVAGLLLQHLATRRKSPARFIEPVPGACVAMALAAMAGLVVHDWLAQRLQVNTDYAQFVAAEGMEAVAANVKTFFLLGLKFLGLSSEAPRLPEPLNWLSHVFRVLLPLGFVALAAATAVRALQQRNGELIFLTGFVAAASGLIVSALILGGPLKRDYGVYYLFYAIAPGMYLVIYAISQAPRRLRPLLVMLALVPALMLSTTTYVASALPHISSYRGPGINQRTSNADKRQLIAWLGERGLTHGYSSFWEANAITVLSSGRIVVAPGSLKDQVVPFKWLTSSTTFDAVKGAPRIFIAVHASSLRAIPPTCSPHTKYLVGPYRVYVFPRGLGDCRPSTSRSGRQFSGRSPRTVRRAAQRSVEADARRGSADVAAGPIRARANLPLSEPIATDLAKNALHRHPPAFGVT